MNYCYKCQSLYEKPGTCNCFAQPAVLPNPQQSPSIPDWLRPPRPDWLNPGPVYPFTTWCNV